MITDYFIGFHSTTFFTWGSVIFIGLLSQYFVNNLMSRMGGALIGACLFYIITNFGVWSLGGYGYSLEGMIVCYTLALPFFGYTVISTIIFSAIIELYLHRKKYLKKVIN